jgi:hypothetical protein
MTKLILTFLLLNIASGSMTQNKMGNERKMVFEIVFQDFFENDTILLRINKCDKFKNIVLTSNKSTGLTDKIFKGYHYGKDQVKVFLNGSPIICNYSTYQISLVIILNGAEKSYSINLKKGIFLGFSKWNNNDFSFTQSAKPFQCD